MNKGRLLLIDDEKDFVDTLTVRLEAKGYDIIKAFDGKEGLEKAHAEKPDLIVLDIMMPEMSGYDVCRKLKVDQKFNNIPIIILTAKFEPNDIRFGKDMGADAYLTKPVELNILSDKIAELLKNRGIDLGESK